MPTNLGLDDELIDEAVKVGHHASKKEAVNAALASYIRMQKLKGLKEIMGTIDYYDDAPGLVRANKRKQKRRPA